MTACPPPSPSPFSVPGDEGFGVYVHWPFCRAKCPYCDFNSRPGGEVDHQRWQAALLHDLETQAARLDHRDRLLSSVFFGGGTPSLMDPATVAAVIARVRALWPTEGPLEVTLEANPGSVDAARLAALKDAGVTRLSLGVQTLDADALKALGRRHSVEQSLEALAQARALFDRVSVDLIYARPGQTPEDWAHELEQVVALDPTHVSLYQLTVEPGTPLFTRIMQGDVVLPDEDTAVELFVITRSVLADAGLPAYEVSNHARPGQACRHNMVTWRGGDYLGIGPGAHGRLGTLEGPLATVAHADPETWLTAVEAGAGGFGETTVLSREERAREIVMTGLRLAEGVSESRLRRLTGLGFEDVLDPEGLALAADEGLILAVGDALAVSEAGLLLLNPVTAAILAP
ncbi:radical SAM family heme chaperone HemW [Pararhodospirillum photometricum]|uniref:Heme chaperone HemW n=1 Tax=Pararhodospirillum photometricum DSM 122 TaxID=1150469 RepID=H6SLL5_PARPM|nr:radical SAM family heme chaperone HemW [Pararhodospirillum photometricum]CCG08880.1 Coproporphyrinogen III oxidase, anaerobic [Pararhodospirillum photometricum DSM 122]